jgi:hypothetical protein
VLFSETRRNINSEHLLHIIRFQSQLESLDLGQDVTALRSLYQKQQNVIAMLSR